MPEAHRSVLNRQAHPKKYEKTATDFIKSAPGSGQPRPDPVRCAGYTELNDKLDDRISQRDGQRLRDNAETWAAFHGEELTGRIRLGVAEDEPPSTGALSR
ncbi:hypothetical protein J3P97_09510 [Pseudomonas sp. R1-15]